MPMIKTLGLPRPSQPPDHWLGALIDEFKNGGKLPPDFAFGTAAREVMPNNQILAQLKNMPQLS